MEVSIDTRYLSQIVFNDPALKKDMLESWLSDTYDRIQKINETSRIATSEQNFKSIHTLKSNYFMIGCVEMIKACEDYLKSNRDSKDTSNIIKLINDSISQIEILLRPGI
ncbi:MAG: hypothetical protein IT267_12165 [Saprospiraceae bacterium]|nr:hypothetical protein [Saprospiraceae bacterium]